ncbi:MAG: phospholipase D family protein [Verrucomicrobiota bacterium]
MNSRLCFVLGGLLAVTLVSCVTHKVQPAALPMTGFVSEESIAHACQVRTVRHHGTSGFEVMGDGRDAYLARLAMIEAAQKTLDLQYFIWRDDMVGTIMVDRLLAAADRGVKVRLLLDITYGAQAEVRSAVLAAHPNITVAFFNPMTDLKGVFVGNPVPVIGEIDRMQCRMHNKVMIADGSIVVGGGRNLADSYFGTDRKYNMRDLDFIASGTVVQDAAKSYELFWRSPLTHVGDPQKLTKHDHEELRELRAKVGRKMRSLAKKNGTQVPRSMSRAEALQTLRQYVGRMIWAEYEFVADPPERMLRQTRTASPVSHSVEKAMKEAEREVVMHAAYFIPGDEMLTMFKGITDRDVEVRVLTNSLASIDGLTAMSGIANRRAGILDSGVSLHELNARAQSRKHYILAPKLTRMGMHSKGFVSDDHISFIGSYNMDPRSKYINTETGVIIRSPAFAARLRTYLEEDLKKENCWQVKRDEDGLIIWTGQKPGKAPAVHHSDPGVSPVRRVQCWLFRLMPWEDLL